eukprot:TRINITY_DN1990_c0_g1_i1.p1 TRINITY_DN1990_c0_g1~~TRINITY_DN1990_c0_g1_i1.p1  ORF type:complete len:389 (-),score=132.72 TRINITY_DN1990_c0_g1_i1:36-1202(-)
MAQKKKKKSNIKSNNAPKKKEEEVVPTLSGTAQEAKASGELLFKRFEYLDASNQFTRAISLVGEQCNANNSSLLVSLYSNRAISWFYSNDWKKAVSDCQLALTLDPKCIKAIICRALSNFYLFRYDETFSDLETVSLLYPSNRIMQEKLQKAKQFLKHKDSSLKSTAHNEDWRDLLNIDEEDTSKSRSNAQNNAVLVPEMPLLVPAGEIITKECQSVCTVENRKYTEQEAMKEKILGNDSFALGNYEEALIHYSQAIRFNSKENVFFSNRALVYLKMGRFYESIGDCTASIERKPNIKAYARRAAAWFSLNEYFLAAQDYKLAIGCEPNNMDCANELEKCLLKLESEYKLTLEGDSNNEKVKKSLQNVKDDLEQIAKKRVEWKANKKV